MTSNIDQFERALERQADAVDRLASRAVEIVADAVGDEARAATPVVTGRTRDAWKQERRSPTRIDVVNPLPHAPVLDHGSSTQAPQGITAVAIPAALDKAERELERLIRRGPP